MQRRRAKEKVSVADVRKADLAHHSGKAFLVRKSRHGVRQVLVRACDARDEGADARQEPSEIKAKEWSENGIAHAGEFQNGDCAAGLQNSMHLLKASQVIRQVSKAKSDADEIQGVISERQVERVGLDKGNGNGSAGGLSASHGEHGMAKVGSDDPPAGVTSECQCQVACAAADIQCECSRALQNSPQASRRNAAPGDIPSHGKKVIQEVVARRDALKHVAHSPCG